MKYKQNSLGAPCIVIEGLEEPWRKPGWEGSVGFHKAEPRGRLGTASGGNNIVLPGSYLFL